MDAGSVDWVGTYWPAQDGAMSIDMSGADAGTLSQTFATTIGNTYTVSFCLSGNPAGPPDGEDARRQRDGRDGEQLHLRREREHAVTSMNWTQETYSFLATGTSTTLSFVSTTPGAYGPALDNVVVTETVPTKDDCKHGGWRTMIDSAGNHFKNQGDCVSYFATKGKNPGALPPATAPAKHGNAHHDKATDKHGTAHHDKVDRHARGQGAPRQGDRQARGQGPRRQGQEVAPGGPCQWVAFEAFEIAVRRPRQLAPSVRRRGQST